MRSAAVIVFIGLVTAAALYCAQRPTVARGDVLAADLLEANPTLESLDCDDKVPIGLAGATFKCMARFKSGKLIPYTFGMDREGSILVVEEGTPTAAPVVKKTSDPWGD